MHGKFWIFLKKSTKECVFGKTAQVGGLPVVRAPGLALIPRVLVKPVHSLEGTSHPMLVGIQLREEVHSCKPAVAHAGHLIVRVQML